MGFTRFFKTFSRPVLMFFTISSIQLLYFIYFLFFPSYYSTYLLYFPFLQYFLLFALFSLYIINLSYNIFYSSFGYRSNMNFNIGGDSASLFSEKTLASWSICDEFMIY